ncbi:Enhancer of polycomb-like protein 1 [Mycoemilia scoparia]|uniref:Enhancer of polycomb-like protein n=1 Tax=Mycoemilia scoparia TaxID=417184 RepID=A0A9W8A6F4_9FUNG|nr:Enhancer of polycomb-like protein 1 [Mycoemilia scoparia]
MGSAQRFRARKVDLRRLMPVYRATELPDLNNEDINRTVDIETGVEKDEETEHHLQAVISASQAAVNGQATKSQLYIPTPSASKTLPDYEKLYGDKFKQPPNLIRSTILYEDTGRNAYCMDEDDEEWLKKYNSTAAPRKDKNKGTKEQKSSSRNGAATTGAEMSESEFEDAMNNLEALTCHMVFTNGDIPKLETLLDYAKERGIGSVKHVGDVYQWWKERRTMRNFETIIPELKLEDLQKSTVDPYVCFRQREVRQGRKTRRADQKVLEHLRRLYTNLKSASQLFEMCLEREKQKKALCAHETSLLAHRTKVINMRRRAGQTEQSFNDLFTLPASVPASVRRKHHSGQQGISPGAIQTQTPRNGRHTQPNKRVRVSSSNPGRSPTTSGIPALPKSLDVPQYTTPQYLLDMAMRIQEKSRRFQQENRDHIDGTFSFSMSQNKLSPNFWSPNILRSNSTPFQYHQQQLDYPRNQNTAFRFRRGADGRIYLDRRVIANPCPPSQLTSSSFHAKRQMYRLGMLAPKDYEKLKPSTQIFGLGKADLPKSSLFPDSAVEEMLKEKASENTSQGQNGVKPNDNNGSRPTTPMGSSSPRTNGTKGLQSSLLASNGLIHQGGVLPTSPLGASTLPATAKKVQHQPRSQGAKDPFTASIYNGAGGGGSAGVRQQQQQPQTPSQQQRPSLMTSGLAAK